ncbi:hypothetical protein ACFZB5_24255 [Streptomyces nodosus]|uniref:hypothetical protein n=1 Tax=Streptomyces nodosus TaxID=40318 RepID=UPI0036E22532
MTITSSMKATEHVGIDKRSENMKNQQTPEWLNVFRRCGLQVVGNAPQDGPPVRSAIYAVAGFDVEPVASIPVSSPDATEELDQKWHYYASTVSLYGEDGEFLILPPVSGGSEVGWVRVKDLVGRSLPSRISGATGSPEFIAVSIDGRHLCAASVEDYDYWVVLHEFS